MEKQKCYSLGKDIAALTHVTFAKMGGNPIWKIINLEARKIPVNLIFLAPPLELRWILAEPLGKNMIDGHVLKIKRLLAIEASALVSFPQSITLDI